MRPTYVFTDEAAFTKDEIFQNAIDPISMNADFVHIMVSSPGDPHGRFNRILDMVGDDGIPLILSMRISPICDTCQLLPPEMLGSTCPHKGALVLPKWQTKKRLERVLEKASRLNYKADALREVAGVTLDASLAVFSREEHISYLEYCLMQRGPVHLQCAGASRPARVEAPEETTIINVPRDAWPPIVYVCVDPSQCGSSELAIMSFCYVRRPMHPRLVATAAASQLLALPDMVIIAAESRPCKTMQEQGGVLIQHIETHLRQPKSDFYGATVIVVFEADSSNAVQMMAPALCAAFPAAQAPTGTLTMGAIYAMSGHGPPSAGPVWPYEAGGWTRKPGIFKTGKTMSMVTLAKDIMRRAGVYLHHGAVEACRREWGRKLLQQLAQFQEVHIHHNDGSVSASIHGKGGTRDLNDDLAIVFCWACRVPKDVQDDAKFWRSAAEGRLWSQGGVGPLLTI